MTRSFPFSLFAAFVLFLFLAGLLTPAPGQAKELLSYAGEEFPGMVLHFGAYSCILVLSLAHSRHSPGDEL